MQLRTYITVLTLFLSLVGCNNRKLAPTSGGTSTEPTTTGTCQTPISANLTALENPAVMGPNGTWDITWELSVSGCSGSYVSFVNGVPSNVFQGSTFLTESYSAAGEVTFSVDVASVDLSGSILGTALVEGSVTLTGNSSSSSFSCQASANQLLVTVDENDPFSPPIGFTITASEAAQVTALQMVNANFFPLAALPIGNGTQIDIQAQTNYRGYYALGFRVASIADPNQTAVCYANGLIEVLGTQQPPINPPPGGGFPPFPPPSSFPRAAVCDEGKVLTDVNFMTGEISCGDVAAKVNYNRCMKGSRMGDTLRCQPGYAQIGTDGGGDVDDILCCSLEIEVQNGNSTSNEVVSFVDFGNRRVTKSEVNLIGSSISGGVNANSLPWASFLPSINLACANNSVQIGSEEGSRVEFTTCAGLELSMKDSSSPVRANQLVVGVDYQAGQFLGYGFEPYVDTNDCQRGFERENFRGNFGFEDSIDFDCGDGYVQTGTNDGSNVDGIACCRLKLGIVD